MKKLFTILLLASSPNVFAAPATLSWDELVDRAYKNPLLQSAKEKWNASSASRKSIYGEFLPTVSLSGSGSRNEAETRSVTVKTRQSDFSASAELSLFSGFSSWGKLKKNAAAERANEAAYKVQNIELRYSLRSEYFRQFIRQERLALYERLLKRQEQNQQLVSLKYQNGTEARWNFLKTQAELEEARFDKNASLIELKQGEKKIAQLLGEEELALRVKEIPLPQINFAQNWDKLTHPKLQQSRELLTQSQYNVTVARANFYPSLSANYSRGREKTEGSPKRTTESASLNLRWNIFNGLSDHYNTQSASAAKNAAALELEETERNLETERQNNKSSYELSLGRIPVAQAIRKAAEERYLTVTTQYRAGLKSFLEWEQAETQFLQAELQELNAKNEAYQALASLERSLGFMLENP